MLTIQMTASEIAGRLLQIYNNNFPCCHEYSGSVEYCQKNLYNEFKGAADQADWYLYQAFSFLRVASSLLYSKDRVYDLVLITDPWAICAFDYLFHQAVTLLDSQISIKPIPVPKNDKLFFREFALFDFKRVLLFR